MSAGGRGAGSGGGGGGGGGAGRNGGPGVSGASRLGAWILKRTLPPGVVGESIRGDLDQELRALHDSAPRRSLRGWYLRESLKLALRYGALRALRSRGALGRRRDPGGTGQGRGRGPGLLESVERGIGEGARILARSPGLALFAVLAMGLGIGATATMFSVSHGLLREPPYPAIDRLLYVGWVRAEDPEEPVEVTASELAEWREQQSTLEALSAARTMSADLAGTEGPPERVSGAEVTPEAFATLGVTPALGRGFLPQDAAAGSPGVVILGHGLWSRRFGADAGVLGRTLRVNGMERTVVGVMGEGFRFPELEDVWTPLRVDGAGEGPGEGSRSYLAFGRLREGVSPEEARAEFRILAERSINANPAAFEGFASRVGPYMEYHVGRQDVLIMNTLVLIASFVLLVACATVANLLLARAAGRTRELAVRTALGAGRGRIMGQLLAESLVIAALGGLLGAFLAWGGGELFQRSLGHLLPFFWMDCRIDPTVLAFVGILVLLAGVLAGIAPALQVSRVGAGELLRDGDRGSSSLRMGRLSRGLVVAEVALAFGLLATSGMIALGPLDYARRSPGFESARLLTAVVGLRADAYPQVEALDGFYRELGSRLEAIPGARTAALTSDLPGLSMAVTRLALEGESYERDLDLPSARILSASPELFAALGVEAIEGRLFDAGDGAGGEAVALVNRSFAQRFFPGESPVGRRVRPGPLDSESPWATVVGVVGDLRMNGPAPEVPEGILFPLAQRPRRSMHLLLHAAGDPMELLPAVRAAVAELDPDLPVSQPRTLEVALEDEILPEMVFLTLLMICGSTALLLAAVGLFGVLAFSVRRRTREIGIRMALGAEAGTVLASTLRGGMIQVVAGLGGGVLLALALSPVMGAMFPGDQRVDWGVYGVVAALMLATGFVASFVPAARAVRVDPVEALRRE